MVAVLVVIAIKIINIVAELDGVVDLVLAHDFVREVEHFRLEVGVGDD